jgi:quercetin dioxygenase-like cupin family protein
MKKHQICLSIFLLLEPAAPVTGQAAKQQESTARPHHTIVPLTQNGKQKVREFNIPFEVVSGDPDKPGAPFVIRMQNDENQVVPPHWHSEDEHIVIIKGTWYLGSGDKFDRAALQEMKEGDYAFVPKEMRHFGWSKTDVIVQIHGIGPFKIIPVGRWVYLSDLKAASYFKLKVNDRVRSSRGEGVVIEGVYCENDNIIQYLIQKGNGEKFFDHEAAFQKAK